MFIFLLHKASNDQLSNLKFSRVEAKAFIQGIPGGSVNLFHIYFPDPWPKRRHHSRRLVNDIFLTLLLTKLKVSGSIYLATDDSDYYKQMQKSVPLIKGNFESRESHERMIGPVQTTYEAKFAAAGRPLYYMEIRKKDAV